MTRGSGAAADVNEGVLKHAVTKDGIVQCVFSSQDAIKVGTGTTTRRHMTKLYWFIEEVGEDRFSCRQINSKHVPVGEETIINLDELLENYLPEIEFWEGSALPAMQELEELLEEGEFDREDGKYYSAEQAFKHALTIEEKNVRALFNLGIVYLELKSMDKARDMMTELLKLKTPFAGKDQHLFNEFGISLRKSGMYDEAVAYYTRALEYIEDDEHLFYNLSRVHYERGDWAECVVALKRCRQLNPVLKPARDLCGLLLELSNNERLCRERGKLSIPNDVAAAIAGVERIDKPIDMRVDAISPESGRVRGRGAFVLDSRVDSQSN